MLREGDKSCQGSYFQAAGDALHGDGAAAGVRRAALGVDRHWERVAQSHGSETHLDAYLFIFITGEKEDGTSD